uniref:Uncharacterized protein n=1 Tax=Cacopsylla melanoneura TaxID=428564 RepID=A0A8D9F190_9HEMI
MEIKTKTEKQKKLANDNKFSSARNARKIFNLLNEEMKEYSRLFSNLSELVEDRIGGLDSMFELDNQTLDTIYDEVTFCSNKENSNSEKIQMEIDENLTTTGKTKKKRNSGESIEERMKSMNQSKKMRKTAEMTMRMLVLVQYCQLTMKKLKTILIRTKRPIQSLPKTKARLRPRKNLKKMKRKTKVWMKV